MMDTSVLKMVWAALLVAGLLASPAQAETVTYLHTDLLGSVVLETDQNRNVVQRYEYEPYGLPRQGILDAPGYTGHVHDAGSSLVYMQQRYYDPEVGRFLSVDPVGVGLATGANFNRYWYANNNPYKFFDPDGQAAQCLVPGIMQVCMAAVAKAAAVFGGATATKVTTGAAVATGVVAVGAIMVKSESGSGEAAGSSEGGNTNPYDGPVEAPVIVVDGDGNTIPVAAGERITSSPNGEFQQVRDADGNATGTRLDKGGHPGQADPKARSPHAHRPGVTDETDNHHLPLNEPKQRQ
jgi:RHS repeat-associated protein